MFYHNFPELLEVELDFLNEGVEGEAALDDHCFEGRDREGLADRVLVERETVFVGADAGMGLWAF